MRRLAAVTGLLNVGVCILGVVSEKPVTVVFAFIVAVICLGVWIALDGEPPVT